MITREELREAIARERYECFEDGLSWDSDALAQWNNLGPVTQKAWRDSAATERLLALIDEYAKGSQ